MEQPPLPLSGYVLAGGKSSRMGSDKALLQLAGTTLVQRAVQTLAPICERVSIVGSPQLNSIAPTVPDGFQACGPLGGMEAAFRDACHEWLFFLPVDLPFLPHDMLYQWARIELQHADAAMRICYFEADRRPQPLVCLLHRSLLPWVQGAFRRKEYKVGRLFHEVAETLAPGLCARPAQVLRKAVLDDDAHLSVERAGARERIPWLPTPHDAALRHLWFSNLNTPEEFAYAENRMQEVHPKGKLVRTMGAATRTHGASNPYHPGT